MDDPPRHEPIQTSELLTWREDDWLGLWELTAIGGLGSGVPLEDVQTFVIKTVEPGLRAGQIRLGRVYQSGKFEPIRSSVCYQLELVRDGIRLDRTDTEIDLWFDSAMDDEAPARKPGLS